MLIWAPAQLVYIGLFGLAFADALRGVDDVVKTTAQTPPGEVAPFPAELFAWTMVMSLAGVPVLVSLVMLIAWTYRCATAAAVLGIPARREPIWAIVGWLVPVIGYWFPYESVRDCLPPDHPARRDVLRWWLGYVAAAVVAPTAIVLAFVGTTPFVVAFAVLAVLDVVTLVIGLRVANAIDDAHRAALASMGHA